MPQRKAGADIQCNAPAYFLNTLNLQKMEFTDISVQEFNELFGTSIKDYSTFEQAVKSIEYMGYSIYYIDSGRPDDVIQAIEDEARNQDYLNLYHIMPLDIYVAMEKEY